MRRLAGCVVMLLLAASAAGAQTPSRPGPWALDVRGVTIPVPEDPSFYPRLDTSARIPARGFGLELGAHVYVLDVGPSRLGIGAQILSARATTAPIVSSTAPAPGTPVVTGQRVQLDLRTLMPQISFNFGSREGWSYLSGGIGITEAVTKTAGAITGRRESERLNALNFGGGARWFLLSHLAFSFDVRIHRTAAGAAGAIEETPPAMAPPPTPPQPPAAPTRTPSMMALSVSAGFSFK